MRSKRSPADLPGGSFDRVLFQLLLAVVPYLEAAHVLRHGGRVAILDKVMPYGEMSSFRRRLANAVSRVVATDLTRQLGPLIKSAGLILQHREPALFSGLFEAAVARKPFSDA